MTAPASAIGAPDATIVVVVPIAIGAAIRAAAITTVGAALIAVAITAGGHTVPIGAATTAAETKRADPLIVKRTRHQLSVAARHVASRSFIPIHRAVFLRRG